MYGEFEGCEHLLDEIYGYALRKDIPVVRADDEICQAYWQHEKEYARLSGYDGLEREARLREINVHVLEHHALSALERLVRR